MKQVPVSVAMAILYQDRRFLMQLRDDKEEILYPGKWGLFGGHLESRESPQRGLIREIKEEINYVLKQAFFFRCYADDRAIRHLFFAPLETNISFLELNEGSDLDLVPLENVRLGRHYSEKIAEERSLGDIHRIVLLDFAIFATKNLADF